MWTYRQASGVIERDGLIAGVGYSGHGPGRNAPSMENIPRVGPIPRGTYTIGLPHDSETHGPHVLALTPGPENEMYGRSGFLMHGDSIEHPGTASLGCIIMSRALRQLVSSSHDNHLEVVA